MDVSFCGAPPLSWFTVTAGASTLVPSKGLDSRIPGVARVDGLGLAPSWNVVSASDSMRAEKRICNPGVPFTDATLPASVVMS